MSEHAIVSIAALSWLLYTSNLVYFYSFFVLVPAFTLSLMSTLLGLYWIYVCFRNDDFAAKNNHDERDEARRGNVFFLRHVGVCILTYAGLIIILDTVIHAMQAAVGAPLFILELKQSKLADSVNVELSRHVFTLLFMLFADERYFTVTPNSNPSFLLFSAMVAVRAICLFTILPALQPLWAKSLRV